ncbi:MFS transporter [Pigmentiphaga aceris]|uniref:MFS transporter n=1 Tax=Pigmentiphaga aceris TaxID=1940612 RepID=A0A5C0ASE4_9BURK|nr:MFS transporter [Pigmentiphaga aceris]QEI04915.1 MFS transporter [Pigmentiphaga aceris]
MQSQNRWLVLAVVSAALLLIVVDMTVLYTALPRLTHDLHASTSEKLWIINAYALVVSGLLLGMGTLGDRLGHKRLFMAGLGVFGLASLAAAYAPSASLLVVARGFLGVGAAMMMPATLSIIRVTFEDERERGFAIGIWAAVASGGAALGPIIGGALLEHFWWGSVFLINVPIVLLALPLTWRLIPARPGDASRPWDLTGSVQVMIGLIGCAYAIKEAGKRAPSWTAAAIAAVIGIAALAWFARSQRRSTHPLIDFSMFRSSTFSSAVVAAVVAAAALIGMQLALTQNLQLVLDKTPLQAALFMLPLSIASFVSGPLAGRLLGRVPDGVFIATGLALAGAGMAGCVLLQHAPYAWQALALAVLGVGIGATITAASSTIMLGAPPERAGMAASIEEVSYELGGAIGVTLMGSLLSAVYAASFSAPTGVDASAASEGIDEALMLAQSLSGDAAAQLVLSAQAAFGNAFDAVMGTTAVLLLATALGVLWRNRKGSAHAASGKAAFPG